MIKGKILIVDDVPKNIQMAMNILKNEGHHMFYAQNGKRALELVQENDFDLILLDIMMPILDGFETIKKIRTNTETKNVNVSPPDVPDFPEKSRVLTLTLKPKNAKHVHQDALIAETIKFVSNV